MIKIIMGQKGSGKTKAFIDMVNNAVANEKGNVICIADGCRHLYDLKSDVRLVDTTDFKVHCYKAFYGFICGIIARDYDITHIFIDSVTKIANPDFEKLDEFLGWIEEISVQFNISFSMTISADVSDATDKMQGYIEKY